MTVQEIKNGIWYIGAEEAGLRVFRRRAFSDGGLSFGAYLLDTGDGFALLGSVPERYAASLMDEAAALAGEAGLRRYILFGTDTDAACLRAASARFSGLTVLAGTAALFSLNALGIRPAQTVEIRADRILTLGQRTLAFHVLADRVQTASLYVLDRAAHTLFTADAFGSFGTYGAVRVSELADAAPWERGARQYFADTDGERRADVLRRAAELIQENSVDTVCPALGPVIDGEAITRLFALLPQPAGKNAAPVAAIIHTGSAALRPMANAVMDGLHEQGVAALDIDLSAISRDEALDRLSGADAYLFGTDDCDGNAAKAVWDIVTSLEHRGVSGKRAAVFYTQNAGKTVPDALRTYLAALGMKLDMPDFFVVGTPTEKDLKNAADYGFGIACCVLNIPNPRKPKLLKCLVCGEIFDASLGACPVCGVGIEQCAPVDEEEITYRNDSERRYFILGGSVAGVSAAEAIRLRDATGEITILSAEKHLPIHRPMLTKGIIDEVVKAPKTIYIHPAEWYAERSIDLRLGVTATAIRPDSKTVETADGTIYNYDKLILAVGAECFVPPFKGHELDGVLTLRHLADAEQFVAAMSSARRAVVIGGGVLGLEAAGELMKSAVPVTVLEAAPQIMGRQIDAVSAAFLRERMQKAGIDCHEGVSIAAIEGDEVGQVTGVALADGRFFPADIVVVSCGMKANTALAADAGIESARAVQVDMFMRTSAPDIYACGDCCEYEGVNFQLVPEATEQGRVAGAHAAGDQSVHYANGILGMHIDGVGAAMYAIGDTGKDAALRYQTVQSSDEVSKRRECLWFAQGTLRGAVVINADEKIQTLTRAVQEKAAHEDLFGS